MTPTDPQTRAAPAGATPRRVLVIYATRFGSTRGVAERIASRLTRAGHQVDLRPCEEAAVDHYDAVVLGSPVFNQRWLPEADSFLHESAGALAARPVWLFSVGTFGDDKPLIGPLMRREPRNIEDIMRATAALDHRVFAGVIDRHQWPLGSRLFYHALGGRLGDNRNWGAIDAWADSIGESLDRRPSDSARTADPGIPSRASRRTTDLAAREHGYGRRP